MRFRRLRRSWPLVSALALVACVALALPGDAGAKGKGKKKPCFRTADLQYLACRNEVTDDYFTAKAICQNETDPDARDECFEDAKDDQKEEKGVCREQRAARKEVCELVGPGAYDPSFDPADFDSDFTALTNPNPWFPLAIGNTWQYEAPDEVIDVEVKNATKDIEGVTCIVVNDVVTEDGKKVEDTDDWIGQAENGDVHYCGEIAQNFELFPGDVPDDAELVDVEGSWKHGRDGAKAGILFFASPVEDVTYRQEWASGDAEDVATVLATGWSYGQDPELDELVPQALADLLCSDDCVVTRDFTPVEPDVFERKYYAPGIGLFLEVNPEDGEVVQLVDCNFDAVCSSLPAP